MQFVIHKYAAVSVHMHLLEKQKMSRLSNPLRLILLCYATKTSEYDPEIP